MLTKHNTLFAVAVAALTLTNSALADDPYVHPVAPTREVTGQVRVGNQDPDRTIWPLNEWLLCEGGSSPLTVAIKLDCSKFQPGHEKYLFLIRAKNQSTSGYIFTVVFQRALDGRTIKLTGIAQRNDNPQGFTEIELDPGAPCSSWSTNTEEVKNQ